MYRHTQCFKIQALKCLQCYIKWDIFSERVTYIVINKVLLVFWMVSEGMGKKHKAKNIKTKMTLL